MTGLQELAHERAQVFVVDREATSRDWLVGFLAAQRYGVTALADARAFERAWRAGRPQCVLCDLGAPADEGLQVLRWLRDQGERVPVIGLARRATVRVIADALRLGAINVLEKPLSEDELLVALEEALDGRVDGAGAALETGTNERLARLSPRERQVLDLVVDGLTSRQIALRLGVSKKTVDVHRGKLLRKLEAGSVVDLVKIHAQQRGHAGEG